ncbi:metal-dependent hydrolase family protein [Breznakiella homolactica]|uniref:Amidohydrolase family protein n=1 Tax=Breznakiella homolactica TaxID=2798577 RepID=A0A7T7XJL3_9SPIR|nr:amidohydrolase family protein [Breznakiella homolactica]QQO07463.1 amidohydrolase family protein [Breznakiella homolactica]
MKSTFLRRAVCLVLLAVSSGWYLAAQNESSDGILFRNVLVFDGTGDSLSAPMDVLVRGNRIESISPAGASSPAGGNTTVIDGTGKVLMPGLIDAHWHSVMTGMTSLSMIISDIGYVYYKAGRSAENTLMRGFTTVRDMGGPTFGLKRAIDEGIILGPRIYPSGAMISQTAGHGDFRLPNDIPKSPGAPLSYPEQAGMVAIADGPDEVLLRVREQLRQGASQIKLMAGGGVASPYDPIDVTQFTPAELRAAVEAAENWGTYVAVHVYTPRAIEIALNAGVKSIEHGQLMDEKTAMLIAQHGAWISLQPFLDDEDANLHATASAQANKRMVSTGTDRAYELAKKFNLKIAFGTDTLFDAANDGTKQGTHLAKLTRWFTPAEVLRQATSTNAELMALSGPRNPYPGKLGVVEEGAYADLLLVNGNPLENIQLIADPVTNFLVIMKNGKIYKNTLAE